MRMNVNIRNETKISENDMFPPLATSCDWEHLGLVSVITLKVFNYEQFVHVLYMYRMFSIY